MAGQQQQPNQRIVVYNSKRGGCSNNNNNTNNNSNSFNNNAAGMMQQTMAATMVGGNIMPIQTTVGGTGAQQLYLIRQPTGGGQQPTQVFIAFVKVVKGDFCNHKNG